MRGQWWFRNAHGMCVGTFSADERHLASNIPDGCDAIEGEPPAEALPSAPVHTPDDAAQTRIRAQRRIDALERSQLRAIREHALGEPGARQRLETIDAEIASLRPEATGKPPG